MENKNIIAPCGMNCGLCMAYLRVRNKCYGCHSDDKSKPHHCAKCSIKHCEFLAETVSGFCYDCRKFPCTRLKQLDKRYRTKYYTSLIGNLNSIKEAGLDAFLIAEKKRWTCSCGGTFCIHYGYCMECKKPIQAG